MREPTGENPQETIKPSKNERGNKNQWEKELGGKASLSQIERGGRSFTIVAAEHFSKQAAEYFREKIVAEIVNPEDWYFLIEGKDSGLHECEVAKRVAEERKVPIDDPVFHPFQAEVIEQYLASDRAGRVPREILIGQLAGTLANARGTSDLEEVATILGVANSQELYFNMVLAVAEKDKDPESYVARSKQMFDDLKNISNKISAQVLDYYLRHNPDRKQVALYLGKMHEEIVRMDLSQIPETMRFSDNQIKDLLDRRKARATEPAMPKGQIEAEKLPTKKDKISGALDEMPQLPEGIRTIIERWSDSLFGLEYVRSRGYNEYLNSDSSLHQIWGAAALLAEKVEAAKSENRDLTPAEIKEAENAFLKAAATRRKNANTYAGQGDEIEELSRNVKTLAEVIKRLK